MSVVGWHASEFQKSRTIRYGRGATCGLSLKDSNFTCLEIQIDNKTNY